MFMLQPSGQCELTEGRDSDLILRLEVLLIPVQ